MEPAKIDWKRIDSRFVLDSVYEHINAPSWVDFLAPEDYVDDEAWFCRSDCDHPKTAEDFLKSTPTSKLSSSGGDDDAFSLNDRNTGDVYLKRRGRRQSSSSISKFTPKFNEDSENQNPNSSVPSHHQAKFMKAAIKTSSEKIKQVDGMSTNDEGPRLKSTLSARNLFPSRDILNHITEFCNELKKLATRARERESEEKLNEIKSQEAMTAKEATAGELQGEKDVGQKDRKPLLEVGKEKSDGMEKGSAKEKPRRKKRVDEAENIPISLNMENVKHKGEERLLQIRTNPPSPQCFSAPHAPTKGTPSKASRSRLMERGVLQELKQNKEARKEEPTTDKAAPVSIIDGRQARALDVFWFLKPCTLSD